MPLLNLCVASVTTSREHTKCQQSNHCHRSVCNNVDFGSFASPLQKPITTERFLFLPIFQSHGLQTKSHTDLCLQSVLLIEIKKKPNTQIVRHCDRICSILDTQAITTNHHLATRFPHSLIICSHTTHAAQDTSQQDLHSYYLIDLLNCKMRSNYTPDPHTYQTAFTVILEGGMCMQHTVTQQAIDTTCRYNDRPCKRQDLHQTSLTLCTERDLQTTDCCQ